MHLTIDFETRSPEDIDKGSWKYFDHPLTQILMCSVKVDHGPSRIWLPEWLIKKYPALTVHFMLLHTDTLNDYIKEASIIEAHNAMFERAGWVTQMIVKHMLYPVPVHKWRCSAANGARFKLPRNLDGLCQALGVKEQKDSAGHDLMLKMCKPLGYHGDNPKRPYYRESLQDFIDLINYCLQDTEAEYAASQALPPMPPYALEVWQLDQEINARGIEVDIPSLKTIVQHREKHFAPLLEEFAGLTDGLRPTQDKKFKAWLIDSHGIEIPDMRADTVELYMADPTLPTDVLDALTIRSTVGKSSLAKIDKMIECACSDGRVRDILMYHGAGPGRWTGKGIQIQNFPRQGTLNLHQIIEDLEREPALFNLIHGPVGPALVKCLRGMIKAREGARFLNADYSSVEARFAAWITGDAKVLEIFHTHGKVYEANAASIFGMDVEDISKSSKERLIGKVSELAQTYQGGVRASVSMGRVYKLDMSIVAGVVLPTAASGEMKKSEDLVNMMFSEKSLKEMRITKDTAIALDIVKARWRASRPDITDAWYSLEDCAVKALEHPGSVFQWNGIYFGTTRDFLCMQLPSGRSLYYYKPKLKKVIPPWVDKELPMEEQMEQAKMTVTYLGAKGKGGMERIGMYGGKWLENICQGGCADLLFFSMLNLERGGYPVAFTVHDEVLAEVKNGQGTHEEFLELMTRLPEWAADFPLKAEGWEEDRFRK